MALHVTTKQYKHLIAAEQIVHVRILKNNLSQLSRNISAREYIATILHFICSKYIPSSKQGKQPVLRNCVPYSSSSHVDCAPCTTCRHLTNLGPGCFQHDNKFRISKNKGSFTAQSARPRTIEWSRQFASRSLQHATSVVYKLWVVQ